ncbi:hypothetical protein JAAARDRAFT_198973 [Jaapia argillacea MUCL 33604]|uniref:Chromo domain-containing protein n=1 Tax=Jaapia argillacea MUCL 33604 TaxID=933084 RepID=A0A067P9C3_9AGAM|nr:hypothetical protein JAAARDRAFT_198973 [Jaapia argillacea MUCL 33604]
MELVTISTSSLSPDPTTSDTPLTEPHMASPHPEVEPSTLNLIDGVQSSAKTSKIPLFLPSPTPELDNNPEERPHHSQGFIPPPLSPERASSFSMIQVDGLVQSLMDNEEESEGDTTQFDGPACRTRGAKNAAAFVPKLMDIREEFEVEQILQHSCEEDDIIYLVQWKGYDSTHNSWVPKTDLRYV